MMSDWNVRAFSPEDLERKDYDTLHEHLSVEQDADMFLRNARAALRFLDTEPNPAYGDALVAQVLTRAHLVVLSLLPDPPVYAHMMIKRVSTTALNIESVWRGILEAHNTEHQE